MRRIIVGHGGIWRRSSSPVSCCIRTSLLHTGTSPRSLSHGRRAVNRGAEFFVSWFHGCWWDVVEVGIPGQKTPWAAATVRVVFS